ncbi:MAG: DUF4129 domain-containing protein [Pyrinomonadaceae bacterium]
MNSPKLQLPGNFVTRALGVAAVLFLCVASAAAVPLQRYRQHLHEAEVGLTALLSSDQETAAERATQFTETVNAIRESLPAEQTVEWSDGSMKVNNEWLHLALGQLESVPPTDRQRTVRILEITERLTALDTRLEEFEKSVVVSTMTDDEAKARLAEILRRKEFEQTPQEKRAFERLLERALNWLGKLIQRLFPRATPLSAGSSGVVGVIARVLVIGLALGLIGFVLWKFLPRFMRRSGRKKAKKREARVVLGEKLEADQTAADIWFEAEALARSGNIRAAIRKGYVALLCELGDRRVVALAEHKTNRDYLRDVHEKRALYAEMRQLTNSFEYHWYGFKPATEADWTAFRSGYRSALASDS